MNAHAAVVHVVTEANLGQCRSDHVIFVVILSVVVDVACFAELSVQLMLMMTFLFILLAFLQSHVFWPRAQGAHCPASLLAPQPPHWQYGLLPVGGQQSEHLQDIV